MPVNSPREAGEWINSTLPADLTEALEQGPFHRALQLAIASSGLALSRLEYHLEQRGFHIGRSTLSYWQQGRRRPERADSLQALAALEDILDVPRESLISLLGPRKPRGRWISHQSGAVGWADMWGDSEHIKRLVLSDSRRNADKLRHMSVIERMDVDVEKRMKYLQVRIATQANESGADRSVLVFSADADTEVEKIRVVDLENCRIGRTRILQDQNFAAYELLFDRSLIEKETYLYSYGVDFVDALLTDAQLADKGVQKVVVTDGLRAFRWPVHSYIMEARFDAATLPVRCYHVTAARIGDPQRQVAELILNGHHAAHVALQNVQPGVHGIAWEWE